MVIVSKKIGEYIHLSDVNIFVVGMSCNEVRLGIDAKSEAIVIADEGVEGKKSLKDFDEFTPKHQS